MKVISFASAKGGVGKSTLTINTACAAAAEGATVAVLDCDPQATAVLWRKQRDKRVSAFMGQLRPPSANSGTAPASRLA